MFTQILTISHYFGFFQQRKAQTIIEKIQERCLKLLYNNTTETYLLVKNFQFSMEIKRLKTLAMI